MSKDPTKRARQLANLKPLVSDTEEDQAIRDLGNQGKRARALIRNGHSPFRLDDDEWEDLYVRRAFVEDRWQAHYRQTRAELLKQYVVEDEGYGQYRILVENVATLHTLVASAVARGDWSELVQTWREQLRGFIGALQKYTEAVKRVDFIVEERLGEVVYDERVKLVDRLMAIVERRVSDPATRRMVFHDWEAVLKEKQVLQIEAASPNGTTHEGDDE